MNGLLQRNGIVPQVHDESPNEIMAKASVANEIAFAALKGLADVHEIISGPTPTSPQPKEPSSECFRARIDMLLDSLRKLNDGIDALKRQFVG